uniref:Rubicon Homology domain-containing protein n=1 Tax=Astatotilapia calliptera TaxID=8154 RepID=A0AAX7U2Q1_ASTCA
MEHFLFTFSKFPQRRAWTLRASNVQAVLRRLDCHWAEPGYVSSLGCTTVSHATKVTPPSSPHAWYTTGMLPKERMGQRTYLLESNHLYSVKDLRQVAEGQYVNFLRRLVQHACNHVFSCDLCTQRGYICQICHSDDTIFPFQFETTTRCEDCKALFHISCKADEQSCPRCQRMRKYMERDLQD